MAIHARSTTAPTRPFLPFVQRPDVPSDDPRSAVEILDEIRRGVERQEPGWAATAGLSPAQEALQTARRKELYEILHPETRAEAFHGNRHTGSRRQIGDGQNDRFTTDTAERTGRSERAVQRDAARGEALGADLKRVSGTSLDPLPPPAPLPTLRTALSRRAALFGAVTATGFLGAAAVDALPARTSALSPNDARLVELADAYAALDTEVDAMPSTAPGYSDLIERYKPLEDEMVTTPADTIVGVGAKARVCQLSSLRDCMSDVPLSVADDVWRLHAAGGLV